jgi:hypothetical protein
MKDVTRSMEELLAKMDHAITELQEKVARVRKETDEISIEMFIASVDHLEEAFVAVQHASAAVAKASVPRSRNQEDLVFGSE